MADKEGIERRGWRKQKMIPLNLTKMLLFKAIMMSPMNINSEETLEKRKVSSKAFWGTLEIQK